MSGAVAAGSIAAEAAATADAFAMADAVYAGSSLAAGEIGVTGALDLGAGVAGDAALGAAGDAVAGTAGNVAGDLANSTAALNPAADTVAGSGPGVTSSAASAQGATDTASNVAAKTAAVTPQAGPSIGDAATMTPPSAVPPAGGKGIISSITDWAKANPALAAGAVQTIGGAAAGAGKAMVDQSKMEKKAALDLKNQIDLAQFKTNASTANAYTGSLGVAPSAGGPVLTRADGSPVYAPGSGIINRTRAA